MSDYRFGCSLRLVLLLFIASIVAAVVMLAALASLTGLVLRRSRLRGGAHGVDLAREYHLTSR